MSAQSLHPPAEDLLVGVPAIALFMFGSDDKSARRRIHYWIETKRIPVTKLPGGRQHLASKAALRATVLPDAV